MALKDTLLEAVRNGDVHHAAVKLEHLPMCSWPVPAAGILGHTGENEFAQPPLKYGDRRYVFLIPKKLRWMSQAEVMNNPVPVDLCHPQRVHHVPRRIGRTMHAIADLPRPALSTSALA